jgi:hypothetical protein
VEILVGLAVLWAIFAGLGYYVAGQRGRPEVEVVVLGFLFGPLGVLIVLLLPTGQAGPRPASRPSGDRFAEDAEEQDERQACDFLTGITPERPQPEDAIDMGAIARAVNRNGVD